MQGSGATHPVGPVDRPPVRLEGVADSGIVVHDDGDRALGREPSYYSALDLPGRPSVAVPAHDHADPGEPVARQPALGVVSGPLGPASKEHDVVTVGAQPFDDGESLRERLVVRDTGEERGPVLLLALDVTQPVPDVGEDAVEIDDAERTVRGHAPWWQASGRSRRNFPIARLNLFLAAGLWGMSALGRTG